MKHIKMLSVFMVLLPTMAFSLTLKESVNNIILHHPKFKESVENFNSIKEEYKIAENGYYPTLDLLGSYGAVRLKSPSTGNRKISSTQDQTSLVLTQNLFNGYATKYMIEQQRSRLDAAGYKVAESSDRLILSLTKAYIDIIKEKKLIKLSEENVKTHQSIYNMIKQRSDSGFSRISDAKQSRSRLVLAKSNLIAQKNDYKDSLSTFKKLYGKDIDVETLVEPKDDILLPGNFEKVKYESFACNPTLRVQEANIRYVDAQHEGSSSAFYPKIDLELAGSVGHDLQGVDGAQVNSSALLKVRYNLYNQGADYLNQERLARNILKEKATLSNTKRDLSESVKFSWDNYVATKQRIELLKEHVKYSKETLSAYQKEFSIGKRDLINVLDAEGEYYTARKALVEAQSAYLYDQYRLLDNMGVITDYFKPGFSKVYRVQTCSYRNIISSK